MKNTLRRIGLALAIALVSTWALATTVTLISGKATTGVGLAFPGNLSPVASKTYQVLCRTTAGTGSGVVAIEGSNDGVNFDPTPIGTVTLPLTTASAPWPNAIFTSNDRATRVRANVTTLTGTGANCTATMGY